MEFEQVDRITADAIGDPGARVFYLQARQEGEIVTILVEKQQVQLLAASILEVLSRLDLETGPGPAEDDMGLESPVDPLWRAGRLSIGYAEDTDRMLIELDELIPDDEDGNPEREGDHALFWGTREQMLSLSRHGALVCEQGRPKCEFCGNPMDPEGHTCPATNGHKRLGTE
jgi:uncharacterized repeat protein (TIGR03847 family)